MPTPVIIDCDPGHDDVFALWLAAGNPEVSLLGVTTVAGNGELEHTTTNARIALTVAGVEGVPVAAGADGPLRRKLTPATWIHGDNALGGPVLPAPAVPLDGRTATELTADLLEASAEPVTLIPTGPLTNVALFLEQRPGLRGRIREIIWMGGSTGRGNVGAYAEFNAWSDPEAADLVFRSGLPVTMVGLNISHQALVTEDVIASIAAIGNETSAFGVELLRFFCAAYEVSQGMPDGPLHDPITVAIAIDRAVAEVRRCHVDVETRGEFTAGATAVDLRDMLGKEHNADVAISLDVPRFWRLVRDAVAALR
ncbi:purine nucleosidase/pyrimidine-specific ribonucleoside hydrolase [Lentzea fradiae]|uniref:Purine nucleosidase/pyrimidine-specific ribonucleoside hydrolase n=1 Tax=Lentzea fradiae TaxID=200378 RepID=A0A1G7VP32_9PSEU|nr:nucleoside hydrolase [Lentzea fradiae]SDG61351.1 purine nucleosidase/pyrimidine-specific ribonucleoside hydrolase [Lentzea fradiae]